MITLLACVDMDNGIGNIEGNRLYEIEKSEKRFKELTDGKIVVLGRKTFELLPKKYLTGRKFIVMSRNKNYNPVGVQVVHDIDSILKIDKTYNIYVIGGEEIFNQFIEFADNIALTQVYDVHKDSYYYFPDFSYKDWVLESNERVTDENGFKLPFGFTTYKRKARQGKE